MPDVTSQAEGRESRLPAWLPFLLRTLLVVSLCRLLETTLFSLGHLPASLYSRPVIALELLKHKPLAAPLVALAVASIACFWKRGWSVIEEPRTCRLLIAGIAAVFAWSYSTYSYNYFFDQTHLIDRVLLVCMAVGVYFNPGFLFGFLILLVAVVMQFDQPLGGYSWTDKILPFRVLALFAVWLPLQRMWKSEGSREFVFACLCCTAMHYFAPGWAKVELRWWEHGQVYQLVAAACANGWLAPLKETGTRAFVEAAHRLDPVIVGFTLAVELGSLFLLASRRIALGMLAAFAALHLGIFAVSGIFFWKWIVLDAVLFAVIQGMSPADSQWLFARPRFALSVAVVVVSMPIIEPPQLGWYDTRLSYSFQLVGRGVSGKLYPISAGFMAPYDLPFAQNRFGYLTNRRLLVGTYGATLDRRVADLLSAPAAPEEIEAWEREYGTQKYDPHKAQVFEEFIGDFFRRRNASLPDSRRARWGRAPHHIWTLPLARSYDGQEPLEAVAVRLATFVNDENQGLTTISVAPLSQVDLASARRGALR